jgi:hypothetical protein
MISFKVFKNFYEKKKDELYALVLPFNNFKIGIPGSTFKGMYNFNLLSRIKTCKACEVLINCGTFFYVLLLI